MTPRLVFWWTWLTRLRGDVSFGTARQLVRAWHPAERCRCGSPTRPRLTGAVRQWECSRVWGRCGYSRYEHL